MEFVCLQYFFGRYLLFQIITCICWYLGFTIPVTNEIAYFVLIFMNEFYIIIRAANSYLSLGR